MSCSVDYSTLSKCDSFLHSQKLHYKTTPTCLPKGEGHTEENYFEIGQREFRKVPVRKKISFKVKKTSSSYRRNIDSHKKICINSSHVAQLTQKFNDIVAENNSASIPAKAPQLDAKIKNTKHQIHNINGTHITLYRKPSLDKALVIIKTKPVIKENSIKKQSSVKESNNVHNRIISAKNSTNPEPQECSTPSDVGDDVKYRLLPQNNNMVQAKIEIFERKSFVNEDNTRRSKKETAQFRPRIPALVQILQTPTNTKVDETDESRPPTATDDSEGIQNSTLGSPTLDKGKCISLEKEKEVSSIEKVQIPQRKCESMYETIIPESTLDSYKSKSFGAITSLDIPIKPNNSFLWGDKSPTRCYSTMKTNRRSEGGDAFFISMLNNHPAPELPPKPNSSPKTAETFNPRYESFATEIQARSSKSLERKNCSNLENVDEGYELVNTDGHAEENIYEAMSSVKSTPDKKTSSLRPYSRLKDNEDAKSNFYEKIYNKSGKKNGDNESIYESVYESNVSCSNRDSLTSEQNSNSLYGKNLWEQEDDASTYKAISEISDEWVDVSENEEEGPISSGVIIIHEKQRSKKSSWSQHLRGQWAKSDPPLSVTADSDSDHHYESLYTAYEQQDDDYDSFESDSDSEKSVDKRKSDESFTDTQDSQLPKPPNAQPYGLIRFAGKHMKKLKNNFSIDLSKSLSRMTKRISRTDLNLPNSIKEEKPQPITSQYKVTEAQEVSRSSTSTIGAIYQNVQFSKVLPPKPTDEKERISFLKKIRRSMSMSTESALELTSNLANKRRSTFYLTETIDIDRNENDESVTDNSMTPPTPSKPNVLRPRSPPPPAPVKDQKKNNSDIGKVSLPTEDDVIRNNADPENQSTFWYAEIDLYRSPQNTPSTSTAENSGSNTSYTIKSSESINQDVEDYYNMKNKNDHSIEGGDKSDGNESNEDESFRNATPDIQLLLQDEPLYQFYDAAILESVCRDGVSDIDSDTYEEIDEDNISEVSSNRPSAMELVLPNKNTISFTKTLWCEIPEVTQSSVLGKLSARQKKLQEAKFEIITSEASYLNSLNVLHDHFASNIRKFVSEKEWEILFGKVIAVRTCSERMLQELEKCWQDNILLYGICDIVQKEAEENFYVYIHYCENQILLGDTLKQIMKKPGFTEFLKELESSASCQFLTLYSFLMLPMQRVTRWPLLVDAVLKRLSQSDPEYLVCQYALSSLNKIVNQCNEAARRKEREIELQNISRKLEFAKDVAPVNIILPNRWLVRSGVVTNIQPKNDDSKMTFGKRFNKVQLYLYLFNDLFLVTKEKSCGTYTILHYCPRNLVELNNNEVLFFPKKDCPEKNLLFLTILENQEGKTVELLLSCNKESDKERWIEAITPPKSEDPEETLYECWDCPQVTALHNYNGIQPDELTLARGDVINVLRKMADGWYHGERIRDGQMGWFPANYTSEIVNPHVRARNLKQRYRLLAYSENYLKSN